jgi:alpha-1,3-rhamnosyl/mannosyltransferase
MRIAISGLVTSREVRGVGRYVAGLLGGFAALNHDDEITVYVGSDCPDEITSVSDDRIRFVRLKLRHDPRWLMRPLFVAWQQLMPAASSTDVLHVPNLVPTIRRTVPIVTTLHDLTEWSVPDKYSVPRREYRRIAARAIARWSDRVLVPTVFTGKDVMTRLGVEPTRIVVTPFGVDEQFLAPAIHDQAWPTSVAGVERYLLYVGSDLSHKNLDRVLRAAAMSLPERSAQLVLAGVAPTSTVLGRTDHRWVRALGRVDTDELRRLYRGAVGLVFPSLCEGFGLPVLEAFASGCPVLTSVGTACAEVADGAALLVDPLDANSIAAGMRALLDDGQLRDRLADAGRHRVAAFTWQRCAEITRGAYEASIAARRGSGKRD